MRNIFYCILVLLFLGGCSTNRVTLDDLDIPLYAITKSVEHALPGGKRSTSQNGRTIHSNYFLKVGKKYINAAKMNHREFAIVKILGDRRPYTVEVQVIKEKRVKDPKSLLPSYMTIGFDKVQTRIISRRILKLLNKRRDGVNIIDEFRVF